VAGKPEREKEAGMFSAEYLRQFPLSKTLTFLTGSPESRTFFIHF